MRRFCIAAAVVALPLSMATPALAQERERPRHVRQIDADNSGTISRDEWRFRLDAFDRLDVDKDAILTAKELQRAASVRRGARARGAKRWRALDEDNNGVISSKEWRRRPEVFDRLDRNREGVLDRGEFVRLKRSRRARR